MKHIYIPVSIKNKPDLGMYVNDKIVFLDEDFYILKVVSVGLLTEWEAISNKATYWLKKTDEDFVHDLSVDVFNHKSHEVSDPDDLSKIINQFIIKHGKQDTA